MNKIINGKRVELTKIEEDKIKAEWAANDKLAAANKWKEDRQGEYPSIVDQLDLLYHEGLDGWKLAIKAIKDKYPKPE